MAHLLRPRGRASGAARSHQAATTLGEDASVARTIPWLAGTYLLVVIATTTPYLLGWLAAPAGQEFGGALNNTGDLAQYLAMIRQGAAGHWFYRDQFTDLHAPHVLMFSLYALLGQTFGRIGLPPQLIYQLGRILCTLALLVALSWFCGLLFGQRQARRYACELVLLSAGLYWLALVFSGPLAAWGVGPADLTAPEYSVLTTILGSPHVTLGLAAQLAVFGCYLRGMSVQGWSPVWRWGLGGAAAGVTVGLSYPFNLLPIYLILAIVAVLGVLRLQRASGAWSLKPIALATLILLPSVPVALYYSMLFHADPIWRTSGMAVSASASPLVYLLAFGPLAALAVRGSGGKDDAWMLVTVWAVVPVVLLAAPLWQVGRVTNGWSVALALLAARGLLCRTARPTTADRAARRWLIALSLSNLALVVIYGVLALVVHPPAYYVPRDLAAVGEWLERHGHATDVALSSARSGNVLAARSDVAVVAGQNFQTFDPVGSQQAISRFFSLATAEAERRRLLAAHRVTYVLDGPWEAALGRYDPGRAPFLTLAFRQGAWRLYHVTRQDTP